MPLYEYFCSNCHHKFDQVLTVREHETKKIRCPKCESPRVEKVIELPTVITSSKTSSW